jgi:hypothetical protein
LKRYGKLQIVSAAPSSRPRSPKVIVVCDCGNSKEVGLYDLHSGHTRSCGCLRKQVSKDYFTTHGKSKSKEYKTWARMVRRCHDENSSDYGLYGKRGIKVQASWRNSFVEFYKHVGDAPSKSHTIDRINNDKGYEAGNVRWATVGEQNRNKRSNVMLTHQGITLCATDWAIKLGIKPTILIQRLARGWATEEALTRPVTQSRKGVVHAKRRGSNA